MHKYIFKAGMRGCFELEVNFKDANIIMVDRGWFNSSALPDYTTFLVLDIDQMDDAWKGVFERALELFDVKEVLQ